MFSPEHQTITELLVLLANIGAPDYAVEQVLRWSEQAKNRGFSFHPHAYTKNANLKWIYNTLDRSNMMLPSVVQIDLEPNKNGVSKSIDIVRFVFVTQLLSLLQDRALTRSKNLVINQGSDCPFGFYQSPDG